MTTRRDTLLGEARAVLSPETRYYTGWVLPRGRFNPEQMPVTCPACAATRGVTLVTIPPPPPVGDLNTFVNMPWGVAPAPITAHVVVCPTCAHFCVAEVHP